MSKKIEQHIEMKQRQELQNEGNKTQLPPRNLAWNGNTTAYLSGNEVLINENNSRNKEVELVNVLEKINRTMSYIKNQQDKLKIKLDACEKKFDIFIRDVNQLKLCVNDILCPLIKEIPTQFIQKTKRVNE